MNYVSTVVGTLVIEDINLELNYMEIIDLTPADFKSSPRLREAHRNKQLVAYDRRIHRNARKFTRFSNNIRIEKKPQQQSETYKKSEVNFSEVTTIKQSLEGLSDKLSGLVNRINILITRQLETSEKLNENFERYFEKSSNADTSQILTDFVDKTSQHYLKIEESLNRRFEEREDKIDKLISKLDDFMEKGIKVNGSVSQTYSGNGKAYSGNGKSDTFDDKVTFVPEINVSDVKTKIKAQEIEQEGTDDILAKLKAMKGN